MTNEKRPLTHDLNVSKMIKSISFFAILIFTTACMRNNPTSINKLIVFSVGTMCTYDSTGTPQLSLRSYLEFAPNKEIKVAKGDFKYVIVGNAPAFSLDKFFEINDDDSLNNMIDLVLENKSYHDSYLTSGEYNFYVMIYETSKDINQITYWPDSLPDELKPLHSYFRKLINSSDLTPIVPFSVDSLLMNYEEKLFLIHPPPPPPSIINSTIHFKVPQLKDTIK